jgi:hypothetical protein
VLVVANPFSGVGQSVEIRGFDQAVIRVFRKGSRRTARSNRTRSCGWFERDPNSVYVDPKTTTPRSFLIADEAFDHLAKIPKST